MALSIVRNDITRMQVDAIVNTTNEYFQVGGLGVDAGIHDAAGPELKEALAEIGFCPAGSAVITSSFGITNCRYIIHTVGPYYIDGEHGESAQLRSCYVSVLALARKNGCRSLAFPLISTGAYRYPKAEAYSIATACIREFLLSLPDDEEMMVYLVLFDRESIAVSEKIDTGLKQFITDQYREDTKKRLAAAKSRRRPPVSGRVPHPAPNIVYRQEFLASLEEEALKEELRSDEAYEQDYAAEDRSFADMCEWWCQQKGIPKKEFYNRANITRAMFWGLKHHPEQIPKKTNALACVIGLKLDHDQAVDLLARAGLTLSKYYETDLIVEYFIQERNYDIDAINALLFDKDLALLGTCVI